MTRQRHVHMHHEVNITQLLEIFNLNDCKRAAFPMEENETLITDVWKPGEEEEMQSIQYAQLVTIL